MDADIIIAWWTDPRSIAPVAIQRGMIAHSQSKLKCRRLSMRDGALSLEGGTVPETRAFDSDAPFITGAIGVGVPFDVMNMKMKESS